jgi:hypothetical protein
MPTHAHPKSMGMGMCMGMGTQCRALVFSVMAAGWFCEKSGCIGKVEDGETGVFKEKLGFNR